MAIEGGSRFGPRLRETLSRITEEAAHLLDVEGARLRLVEGNELVRVAVYGPEGAVMARERLRLGESLSGQVAASGRPLIVANPEAEPSGDRLAVSGTVDDPKWAKWRLTGLRKSSPR